MTPPIPPVCSRLLGVEGGEERVLEGLVLHRLAQVVVHLARRGEDALDTCGGGRRSQVLARHSHQRRPLDRLQLPPCTPPCEEVEIHIVLGRAGEVLLELVAREGRCDRSENEETSSETCLLWHEICYNFTEVKKRGERQILSQAFL